MLRNRRRRRRLVLGVDLTHGALALGQGASRGATAGTRRRRSGCRRIRRRRRLEAEGRRRPRPTLNLRAHLVQVALGAAYVLEHRGAVRRVQRVTILVRGRHVGESGTAVHQVGDRAHDVAPQQRRPGPRRRAPATDSSTVDAGARRVRLRSIRGGDKRTVRGVRCATPLMHGGDPRAKSAPLAASGPPGVQRGGGSRMQISRYLRRVCGLLGVTDDDFSGRNTSADASARRLVR